MSLDVAKLQNVRKLEGGGVQARCPACAEGGHDRTGEHLRIYPDGRFGCCVHPKDGEHRKRIFALAGDRKPGTFTLRIKTPPALTAARSVKAALTARRSGTAGTLENESENGVPSVPALSVSLGQPHFGTLGTPIFNPRAYAREGSPNIHTPVYMCKDLESGVPSVPSVPNSSEGAVGLPPTAAGERLPFLTPGGTLSIPFDAPERYHWWRGGQSVAETLAEVRSRMSEVRREENHGVTV